MRRKAPAYLILSAVCTLGLAVSLPLAAAERLSFPDERFLQSLEDLEGREADPQEVAAGCLRYFKPISDGENLRQVMVGFLEVPEAEAMAAFCEALVEAIASRWLPLAPVREAIADSDEATSSAAIGSILRQVYYAHQRGASYMTLRGQTR